jgi:hypothetical protein
VLPAALWDVHESVLRCLGRAEPLTPQRRDCLGFLAELGLVDGDGALTDTGRAYFHHRWVLHDEEAANGLMREALLRHPVTLLVCQVFHGRGKITRQQLDDLLCEQGICADARAVGRLLSVLNTFRIVCYSKKTRALTVLEPAAAAASRRRPSSLFVSPRTPFTNVERLRELVGTAKGHLVWLDKHLDKKVFPVLAESLDGDRVAEVTLVSSDYNLNSSAQTDFDLLRQELAAKGISLRWIIVRRQDMRDVHDRWLICDDWAYNVPPVNSIFGAQAAELIETEDVAGRRQLALQVASRGAALGRSP